MHKFMRNCLTAGVLAFGLAACGDDVTITQPPAPPAVPNITTFSVAPAAVTLTAGQTVQASYNLQLAPTLTGTVAWISGTTTVATVDASGKITAVAPGTAVITATATSGGQTSSATIGVTVVAAPAPSPPSISIASVTQGLLTLPVNLSNVNGQIEINLNFSPGGQLVDSVVSYIGTKRAAVQSFSVNAIPAAGMISMSVNTANFRKNFNQAGVATPGATQVDFLNGPTTINAIVYPKATTGQSAGNCTNAPPGVAAVCSANSFSIIMNNLSGWAADVTKPTATGIGIPASSAIGQTFWGGPTAGGVTSVTLYPVIYEAGRSINTVTFGMGGCPTVVDATLPFTQSFGYTAAGATVNCTSYEWIGGIRDNVSVFSAIDNASNSFPNGGLIANTTVFGSTPDSLRLDYKAPASVTAPVILGSEGFNWLNDGATIRPVTPGILDVGVGGLLTSYAIVVGPSGSGTFPTTFTTVAALAETNTNCALPTAGCDGYAARASGTDVLGNTSNSTVAATFGVDRTLPTLRYSSIGNSPSIFIGGGTTAVTDSTTRIVYAGLYGVDAGTINNDLTDFLAAAAGTNDSIRVETIDNRAGLSRTVVASRVFAQGGATGTTTNTGCQTTTGTFGAALIDGFRPTSAVHVTCGSAAAGYYTTTYSVVDRAGNVSATYRRTVAIDPAPPQVTGVSPVANYLGNGSTVFQIGVQDDLEVIDARIRLRYNNVLLGDGTTTAATALTWNYGFSLAGPFGTRFDNSIINPFLGTITLDMFTISVQETCTAATLPYAACQFRGDPVPTTSQALVKPDSVAVTVRDVWGSFAGNIVPWNVPGRQTGVSAEFASPILSATVPATGAYTVTYNGSVLCLAGGTLNGPCVIGGVNWRNFGTTATTRTFRATEAFSTTLPVFTRVDLFGLNAAGEWVYIQRITVPAVVPTSGVTAAGAGTITGSDNGLERYWDYTFTGLVTTGFTQFRALGVNAAGHALFSTRMP